MSFLCLVTFQPKKIWCEFLSNFTKYKIVIIIDDNTFDTTEFINTYENITFVQIDDEKCKLTGYVDSSFMTLEKLISGWDKALYYFGIENTNYDFVWFIEDDVFFNDENTLLNIDSKYIDDDLLSNQFYEKSDTNVYYWHWYRLNINFDLPYYKTMVCAVRFSKNMMKSMNDYALAHNTLFFIEAFFPTICVKSNLKYSNPSEFFEIHWRHEFEKENINSVNLYHPVKNLENHLLFRSNLILVEKKDSSMNTNKKSFLRSINVNKLIFVVVKP